MDNGQNGVLGARARKPVVQAGTNACAHAITRCLATVVDPVLAMTLIRNHVTRANVQLPGDDGPAGLAVV